MEERVPSSAADHGIPPRNDHNHSPGSDLVPLPPPPGANAEHVLVVQIPKDQIYRVPPPENALIIERHRNPDNKTQRKRLCGCFSWRCCVCLYVFVFIVVAIIVLIRLLPYSVSYVFLPRVPVFHVERFSAKNGTHSGAKPAKAHLDYDITVTNKNPNAITGIFYREDGIMSLLYKGKDIAEGKYPTSDQGAKETSNVKVSLEGLVVTTPAEIHKSITSEKKKVNVPFSLKIDVPAKMNIGVLPSGTFKFVVSCDFVVDTLAKTQGARILSQTCVTERKRL